MRRRSATGGWLQGTGRRNQSRLRGLVLIAAVVVTVFGSGLSVAAEEPPLVRGAYDRDESPSGLDDYIAAGFNTVNGDAYVDLLDDIAAKGLKAVVWLGPYDADTCSFEKDDAWIRENVANVAGHPAIVAYQLDDEPSYERAHGCPQVVDQMRARSDLVKSIDPSIPTYLTLPAWDGVEDYPYQYFAGTADIIGLVLYPCNHTEGCGFEAIDQAIAQADADGIGHYWAVMQAYDDDWYQLPTFEELTTQLDHWSKSRMEGYFIYDGEGLTHYTTTELAALNSRVIEEPLGADYVAALRWLSAAGVTANCDSPAGGRFCPEELVTRGQLAAFLVRVLELVAGGRLQLDVERLAEAGTGSDCDPPLNDRYCPEELVSRGQLAAFLERVLIAADGGPLELDTEAFGKAGVGSDCDPASDDRLCSEELVTWGQLAAYFFGVLN
jgi:hypothetical protein